MNARQGGYGVKSYDRTAVYTDAMLVAIERELPDVAAFTRDDLMYLSVFEHVATITRYAYVRLCVNYARDTKRIIEVEKGTFILAGTKRRYKDTYATANEFEPTIIALVNQMGPDEDIRVPQLLDAWETDQYLSTSTKRTMLRETLKSLARRGFIEVAGGIATYRRK